MFDISQLNFERAIAIKPFWASDIWDLLVPPMNFGGIQQQLRESTQHKQLASRFFVADDLAAVPYIYLLDSKTLL